MREVLPRGRDQLEVLLGAVEGQDQEPRLLRPRGRQQVVAGGVAVEDRQPEFRSRSTWSES